MDELTRIWHEIVARPSGPLAMRFYLQPLMATGFAIYDGLHDARNNRPAYLWAVLTRKGERLEMIRSGWASVGKIFIVAFLIDTGYTLYVLGRIRPISSLLVATTLALVPYLVLRGPVNRIARTRRPERGRRAA